MDAGRALDNESAANAKLSVITVKGRLTDLFSALAYFNRKVAEEREEELQIWIDSELAEKEGLNRKRRDKPVALAADTTVVIRSLFQLKCLSLFCFYLHHQLYRLIALNLLIDCSRRWENCSALKHRPRNNATSCSGKT